jgi:YD repeat-containing protein
MTNTIRDDIPLGYTRDSLGNELTYKDNSGHWREYTYDSHGNELTYKNSNGDIPMGYTYDSYGRLLTYTDRSGHWLFLTTDDEYTLRYNTDTGIYWAGCRKFTAERALAHWGSPRDNNHERAALFLAAIKASESKDSQETTP